MGIKDLSEKEVRQKCLYVDFSLSVALRILAENNLTPEYKERLSSKMKEIKDKHEKARERSKDSISN